MNDTKLAIRLMGPFEVRRGGDKVAFPARSAAAVVALLALSRPRSVSRSDLAETLWPDSYPESMGALRTAVFRVRQALRPSEPVVQEGDRLHLSLLEASTDLDEADALRRQFQVEGVAASSLDALRREWVIRRAPLLDGWEDVWILPHRERLRRQADEVAVELALALEESELPAEALEVWRQVLERVPNHIEAIRSVVRLEYELHGAMRAAAFAQSALEACRSDYGLELPVSLQRALRDVRSGLFEPVRPSDHIRKRSELNLLANMVTRNLERNSPEALALIAQEVRRPESLEHPRTTLALASTALRLTEGTSEDRLDLAAQATFLASLSGEYELAVEWADLVLRATQPEQPIHSLVLGIKGFVEFERRNYEAAERHLMEAVGILEGQDRPDDLLRARGRLAGVWWQQGKMEPAEVAYREIYEGTLGREDDAGRALNAFGSGNLCFLNVHARRWGQAVEWGEVALRRRDAPAPYRQLVRPAFGLALLGEERSGEGLRELCEGIADTYRLRMPRFHQIALDYAAVALIWAGREPVARCVLAANTEYRSSIRHARSIAEAGLVRAELGADPDDPELALGRNPLRGQTPGVFSEWVLDELRRAYAG